MWQKYVIIGGIMLVLALGCVALFYRGQTYKALYKGEKEKVAQRDATIKSITETANIQYAAQSKAIKTYQTMLKECLDKPCETPTLIIQGCPQVTIEPCEAPF